MAIELNEKQKLLGAAVAGAVVLGTLIYLTYDAQVRIAKARTDISNFQNKIRDAKKRIDQIPELRERRYELTNTVEEYVKILPDDREVNALYETVSDLQKESEVQVSSFKIMTSGTRGRRQMSKSFEKQTRDLKITGSFFNIGKFINLLERYKRFMSVENFSMKPSDENLLGVQLKFSTYTYERKSK